MVRLIWLPLTLSFGSPAIADDTDTDDLAVDTDFGVDEGAASRAGELGGMDCSSTAAGWGGALFAGSALLAAAFVRWRG
jgi:hypothetical protein